MATTVTESVLVRRPVAEVAAFATSADKVLPMLGSLGRFQEIGVDADGKHVYDLFLDVGTIHVGGRVVVTSPDTHSLSWESVRGTNHTFRLDVSEEGEHSRLTMTMTVRMFGFLMARATEFLARGIVRRNLVAGLQQVRHHLEHESSPQEGLVRSPTETPPSVSEER